MQRMSALDASFLLLEDASTVLHMASVEIFEAPAPSHDELMALTETAQSCSSKVLTLSGRQGSG